MVEVAVPMCREKGMCSQCLGLNRVWKVCVAVVYINLLLDVKLVVHDAEWP